MQTASQFEGASGQPWLINKTPQGSPRGETESRFFGVCRVKAVGLSFQTSQPLKLGLPGFGGASVCLQPIVGWRTMTPGDVRACIAVLSRSGRLLRGDEELVAWSISSSSPLFSALRSAAD